MIAHILGAGLLDVVAHQTYGFKHQMFQEYLAAVALASQLVSPDETVHARAWDFIWRKHTYSRWREILRLGVGVLVQKFSHEGNQIAIRWLHRLVAERETPDDDVGNLCLELALGSLREFSSIPATSELALAAQQLVMAWAQLLVKQQNWRVHQFAMDVKDARSSPRFTYYRVVKKVEFLLQALANKPDLHDQEKDDVVLALKMGPYAPMDRLRALYKQKSDLRENLLCYAFGFMGAYAPLDIILQALDDEDLNVRVAAEYTLSNLAETAPAMFIATLKNNRRPPLREALMKAIALIGKDAPLDLALTALNDENEDVRFQARCALLELNVDSVLLPIEPLLDALKEKRRENDSHRTTLALLAKMGSRVPAEPLLALLGDSDLDTCKYAAQALYQTHPEEFVEIARQAEAILRGEPTGSIFASHVQSRIVDRVAAIGRATPAVPEMITDLLDWPYWEVRVKAAKALEAIHRNIPDRALRCLLELRHDPESQAVREAADDALAEILSRESGMEDE